MPDIRVFPNSAALALAAADVFIRTTSRAIEERGCSAVLLAGGSTPAVLYTLLAEREHQWYGWKHLIICWGDERCVPPDHAESNYRAAYESLLSRVPVQESNVHRMPGELPPAIGAQRYEDTLQDLFKDQDMPRFDLVLLGMGEDGHTASLFPGSPALNETRRWVVEVDHDQPPPPLVPRLSVTFPLLNAARRVLILVTGENKAAVLARALQPELGGAAQLPIQQIQPHSGILTWMVDSGAAKHLGT